MKKIAVVFLACAMALGSLSGCGNHTGTNSASTSSSAGDAGNDLEGAYVFLMKLGGNVFYDNMYQGFETAIKAADPDAKVVDRSPTERGVTYQLTAMDECLTSKIGALCIATFAETGFDEMNERYKEAGIPIFSADSRADDQYRVTHFNQTSSDELGRYDLWTSILASQRVDITEDTNIREAARDLIETYSGDPICIGLISATPDSPVQLSWHAAIMMN